MIPVPLEYSAPTGCPTRTEFVALVASRGADFARPGPDVRAKTMIVALSQDAEGHAGRLELQLEDRATDARQLRGATCTEVAEALSVVAATALRGADHDVVDTRDSAAPPAGPVAPDAVAPAVAPPSKVPATASSPSPLPDSRLRSLGLWRAETVDVPAGPLRVDHSLSATVLGGAVLGALPGMALPRFDLTLTRANFITTPNNDNYLIGSVLGVRWSLLGPITHRSGTYSTEMFGIRAGVRSCSPITYDTRGLVALFCGSFMVGLMQLDTKDAETSYEQSKEVGHGAAALELDARYSLGKYLHLSAALTGEMWVGKASAERADGSELFHSRLFNASTLLGLGIQY